MLDDGLGALGVEDHARGDQAAGDVGVAEDAQGDAVRGLQVAGQDVPHRAMPARISQVSTIRATLGRRWRRTTPTLRWIAASGPALETKIASMAKNRWTVANSKPAPTQHAAQHGHRRRDQRREADEQHHRQAQQTAPCRAARRPGRARRARRAACRARRPAGRRRAPRAGGRQAAIEPAAEQQAQADTRAQQGQAVAPAADEGQVVARARAARPDSAARSGPRPATSGR